MFQWIRMQPSLTTKALFNSYEVASVFHMQALTFTQPLSDR